MCARCRYVVRTRVERIHNQRVDELVCPEEWINKRKTSYMANAIVAVPVEGSATSRQVVDHAACDHRVGNQLARQAAHSPWLPTKLDLFRRLRALTDDVVTRFAEKSVLEPRKVNISSPQ
jgi:hypothetical protein